ncbi:MAG: LamG domain-containing protein [Akkermansiaceae bacterium]|nr:LamG domain-containing protein [Akkermansiaceae bacterium]
MKNTMLTSESGTGDPVDPHVPTSARRFARRSSLVHPRQGKIPAIKPALAGFAAWALLGAAASASAGLVHRWSFNGTANDSVGTAHGTLFGNTPPAITGGKLVLNPGSDQNQYMKTSAFTGETLGTRTLVAWVTLSDLNQPGGAGVLGIHPAGVDNFDSIVYGERVAKQWMNGSSYWARTVANNGGAAETSTGEVMMAIVYDSDNSIKLYHNGVRYDTGANKGTLETRTAPIAILGRRQEGSPPSLQGAINEARIYDYALTDVEIQNLNTLGPDILPGETGINITASAGTGGAISPAGVRVVPPSSTPTYTIIPAIGYDVADVVLDGTTSLGPVTTYTFAAVTAAHTIDATFVAVSPHAITASAGTNGSISPTGAVSVAHRGSQAFTITPDSGFIVADVVLDAGTGSETHLGSVTTYTFANVQTDHTISATFVAGSLVHHWSFNDGTANDSVGTAHGTLYGTATISDGKLSLSGSSENNRMAATLGNALGPNKTLVAWCSLSSLEPNNTAGGPLSVGNEEFDAIVYGERTGGQWMNGSGGFNRTPENNGGALENLIAPNEIMMAITYDSFATNKIKLYRNGVLYAEHNQGSLTSHAAGEMVLIGPRNWSGWDDGYMNGYINEARIYNYALTDSEVAALYTHTQPGGYAAWAASFPTLTDSEPTLDFDGGGLESGIEWVVGGDPTLGSDDAGLAPTAAEDGSGLVFTFARADLANEDDDPQTTIFVEYGSTLTGWTPAEDGMDGVTILVNDDFYGSDPAIDQVVVTLPESLAVDGKLFARLAVGGFPSTVLDEDFESGEGGFTASTAGGTAWDHGAPNSPSQGGGAVTAGNGGSANCWGTGLTGGYIAGTDTKLRSPVIDLTGAAGATLSFAQSLDIEAGHTLVVNVIEEATDTVLESAIHTSTPDPDINASLWATVGGVAITGGQKVRIEWHFVGNGGGSYNGAYIDDVVITTP